MFKLYNKNMNNNFTAFKTPVGVLTVSAENGKITSVGFDGKKESATENAVLKTAKKQLLEYFAGKRKTFDLPLKFPEVSDFRLKIWKEMAKIPCGKTSTYGELAAKAGNAKAARACGGACNKNPFMIVIPCHRVVGSSGALTGYAGGLSVKKYLLGLENGCQKNN